MARYHLINGVRVQFTAEEETARDTEEATANNAESKLVKVKQIRQMKLNETDWMANSDVTMPDYIKTWRQTLRDLPANHTNEDAYNLLLARDSDGKLTHSVWTQPTS
jgi:hypothetical protein